MRSIRNVQRLLIVWMLTCFIPLSMASASELDRIRERGYLTCGVIAKVAGFAELDPLGKPHGFEIDFCRAVSAAIFGAPDKVDYVAAISAVDFKQNPDIDLISRRLTLTLRRDADDRLSFSPIIFYDGAGFLVPKSSNLDTPSQLSGRRICMVARSETEAAAIRFFRLHGLTLTPVTAASIYQAAADFFAHKCDALAADLSEMSAERSLRADGATYAIMPATISKEPLALLTHREDSQFSQVVRWTVFALIAAEELDITSSNLEQKRTAGDPEIDLFLGRDPGNGKALGLAEDWAAKVIESVGNYGEIFDRNIGPKSPLALPRGLNALWNAGGLLYAPPMR